MEKRQDDTKTKQTKFLTAYRLLGSVPRAAKEAEVDRSTVYRWTKDSEFKDQYSEAIEDFRDGLQDIAMDRLREQRAKDNPALLIAMLQAHWPEKYTKRDRPAGDTAENNMRDFIDAVRTYNQQHIEWTAKREQLLRDADTRGVFEEAKRILDDTSDRPKIRKDDNSDDTER